MKVNKTVLNINNILNRKLRDLKIELKKNTPYSEVYCTDKEKEEYRKNRMTLQPQIWLIEDILQDIINY